MKTVKEVSKLTGVSVRTLHYYDEIGLLKPTMVTNAGYRYYDEKAIGTLQTVLLFRELDFECKQIKSMMNNPDFTFEKAITEQKHMLELRRERLDSLIRLAESLLQNGGNTMEFEAFEQNKANEYRKEVIEKWGNTPAYREYTEKEEKSDFNAVQAEFMQCFAVLGALKDKPVWDKAVLAAVLELQRFITEHYYTCTKEILMGLGQMYTEDERFKSNIDKVGGTGTAEFVSKAICEYCK